MDDLIPAVIFIVAFIIMPILRVLAGKKKQAEQEGEQEEIPSLDELRREIERMMGREVETRPPPPPPVAPVPRDSQPTRPPTRPPVQAAPRMESAPRTAPPPIPSQPPRQVPQPQPMRPAARQAQATQKPRAERLPQAPSTRRVVTAMPEMASPSPFDPVMAESKAAYARDADVDEVYRQKGARTQHHQRRPDRQPRSTAAPAQVTGAGTAPERRRKLVIKRRTLGQVAILSEIWRPPLALRREAPWERT